MEKNRRNDIVDVGPSSFVNVVANCSTNNYSIDSKNVDHNNYDDHNYIGPHCLAVLFTEAMAKFLWACKNLEVSFKSLSLGSNEGEKSMYVIIDIKNCELSSELIRMLCKFGGTILRRNSCFNQHTGLYSALLHVTRNSKPAIFKVILDHDCLFYQLCSAIETGDHQTFQSLLIEIDDIEFSNMNEITPLRFSVIRNKLQFVKILLDKGANPNAQETPNIPSILQSAVEEKCEEIVEILLEYGADVNYCPQNCPTPVILAAKRGYSEILKILLKYNPNINFRAQTGYNALDYACQLRRAECVDLLLQFGADPNAETVSGSTVLLFAVKRKSTRILRSLLKWGANPSLLTLQLACFFRSKEVVDLLLKFGKSLDVNYQDESGRTLLFGCPKQISCAKACLLIENGAKLDITDKDGCYPKLMEKCKCEDKDCPLIEHFRKLRLLGFFLDPRNFSNQRIERVLKETEIINPAHVEELDRLAEIVICWYPRRSLFDVLFMKEHDLAKYSKNVVMDGIYEEADDDFRNKFPVYGFILNRTYKKLLEVRDIFENAKNIFPCIIGCILADHIVENIFFPLDILKVQALYQEFGQN